MLPDNKQKQMLLKGCGINRFAYNWALSEWKKSYENGETINEGLLRKKLNSIKYQQFPWMTEVSKCVPARAVQNLGKAFDGFFKKTKGFPKFMRNLGACCAEVKPVEIANRLMKQENVGDVLKHII
jgi:putative transposase